MCLIKHDQLIGLDVLFRQPREHPLTRQRIDAHDHPVAVGPGERVAVLRVLPADDAERHVEQHLQFPLPVPDQSCRGHDQHARQESARQHLAHVQARHNGLPRPRIIGQQEAETGMLQHAVVDSDALVRQRVDARDLRGEGGIGQVSEGKALALHQDPDDLRLGGEVQWRRLGGVWRRFELGYSQHAVLTVAVAFSAQFQDTLPGQLRWPRPTVLPSVDGGERNPQAVGQGHLRQSQPRSQALDLLRVVVCQSAIHARRRSPVGS